MLATGAHLNRREEIESGERETKLHTADFRHRTLPLSSDRLNHRDHRQNRCAHLGDRSERCSVGRKEDVPNVAEPTPPRHEVMLATIVQTLASGS